MNERELHDKACEIFERAIELSEHEREELLEAAERESPQAAAYARRMLAKDSQHTTDEAANDESALVGKAIGPYEIVEHIDAGGMGAVYRALRRDPEEVVAIKFLTVGRDRASALERFRSEAELLASFNHPGIVRYRDSGVTQDGRPFLVMDFVRGQPLSPHDPHVQQGVDTAVDLLIQVADAVQYMNGRLTLHRDLKPSNILVTTDSSGVGRPMLIDLGIAKRLDEGSDATGLTMGPIGSPAYMSPEQVLGRTDIDVCADVFALGAVLYELITGFPPRGLGESSDSSSVDFEELNKRLSTRAQPPSGCVDPSCFAHGARERARRTRGDLDAVVMKAIESDRKDRYQSVEAFRADLVQWREGRPVEARRIRAGGRLWRLVRRTPIQSAVVFATIAAIAGLSVSTRASLARERELNRELDRQLQANEQTVNYIGRDLFGQSLTGATTSDSTVTEVFRRATHNIATGLDESITPDTVVGVGGILLSHFTSLDLLEDAGKVVEVTSPYAESLPEDSRVRFGFEVRRAEVLLAHGRLKEAEILLNRLWKVIPGVSRLSGPARELAMGTVACILGTCMSYQGKLEEAANWARTGLDHATARGVEPFVGRRLKYLAGHVQMQTGDLEASAETLSALLEDFEGAEGTRGVGALGACSTLSHVYRLQGDLPGSLQYAERAAMLARELYPPTHDNRLVVLSGLSITYFDLRLFDEAIEIGEELVDLTGQRWGLESGERASTRLNLVESYIGAGRSEEAFEHSIEVLALLDRLNGPIHPETARARLRYAQVALASGLVDDAISEADQAISALEGVPGYEEYLALAREAHSRAVATLSEEKTTSAQ